MKSGFKMRSGNASSFKMMGSSPAKNKGELPNLSGTTSKKVDLTKKPVGPVAGNKKTEKTKKPTETKKSTVAVDGSLKDAESDYKRDLIAKAKELEEKKAKELKEKKAKELEEKNRKTLADINKEEEVGDNISEGTIESQLQRLKENNN